MSQSRAPGMHCEDLGGKHQGGNMNGQQRSGAPALYNSGFTFGPRGILLCVLASTANVTIIGLQHGRTEVVGSSKKCLNMDRPGAGIMEAVDRQVTTVFTVQPSFHHRHSTNRES